MTTSVQGIWEPGSVLRDDATAFVYEHNPAEEVVAGKVKRNKGHITGVSVYWSSGKSSDKGPKASQAEMDVIGRVFGSFRSNPKAADLEFAFKGEKYRAQKEECMFSGPHVQNSVCFSGSKGKLSSRGIYAMMTKDGYVIVVKTKSFKTTQAAVEGGSGLVYNVHRAALKRAAPRK